MASDWLTALLAANQKLHLKIVVSYPCFHPWILLVAPTLGVDAISNGVVASTDQFSWWKPFSPGQKLRTMFWDKMTGRLRQHSNPPDMLGEWEEALPDVLQNIIRVFLANVIASMPAEQTRYWYREQSFCLACGVISAGVSKTIPGKLFVTHHKFHNSIVHKSLDCVMNYERDVWFKIELFLFSHLCICMYFYRCLLVCFRHMLGAMLFKASLMLHDAEPKWWFVKANQMIYVVIFINKVAKNLLFEWLILTSIE